MKIEVSKEGNDGHDNDQKEKGEEKRIQRKGKETEGRSQGVRRSVEANLDRKELVTPALGSGI